MFTLQNAARQTLVAMLLSFISLPLFSTLSFKEIGDAYVSSYGVVKKDTKQDINAKDKKKINLTRQTLNEQEKRQIIFSLLTEYEKTESRQDANTKSTRQLLNDLAVLHGQQGSENIHIAGILNHCSTTFGEAALTSMLAQKINNPKTLLARQELIKKLTHDDIFYNNIERLLHDVREHTDDFLSVWVERSDAEKEFIDNLYFGRFLTSLNKNSLMLEGLIRLDNLGTAITSFLLPITFTLSNYFTACLIYKFNKEAPVPDFLKSIKKQVDLFNPYAYLNGIKEFDSQLDQYRDKIIHKFMAEQNFSRELAEKRIDTSINNLKKVSRVTAAAKAGVATFFVAYQGYLSKKAINEATQTKNAIKYLQTRLIGAASFVRAAHEISTLATHHHELAQGLSLFRELPKLFAAHEKTEFDHLVSLLQTHTFKGQASFFSLSGRVLAAHKLMEAHKNEFAAAMLALGELDACLSIAKLIKKFEQKRVGYCFVEFVEQEKPYLKLEDFWNPFVHSDIVVTNSIEFGGEQPRSIIVTGSNTGGKSTNLKAIMLSVLLARTFGIAPARSATMTPFSYLGSSMNIGDNTAHGDSLFQAEVKRAERIVNTVESLKHEFGILIIDELFTGTRVEEGAAAAKRVAKHIAESPHVILILATHFPELTKLEQETGLFKNYKVDAYKDENGNLIRPFKLEQGISTSNIADEILQERLNFLAA